ncbi:MAG TPA: DsrE family protein [Chitinophagaceae bacterium]|nr:DsrE family protein [Chitinophagaceae bacterium]
MANPLLIHCTHGKEDPERAILPFIVANVAATADQDVTVFLTIEGVRIATKGYAEQINKEGFTPLKEIMQSFLANGGKIWACGACTKPRGITNEHLIEGAQIVTAANLVEVLVNGSISCTV